jgi:MoaA/NifB/PqqE/SkfB family radical SAM enzyme
MYEIILTLKCNWNCTYCSEDIHNRPSITYQEILDKLHIIPFNTTVRLSGGEVGTLSDDTINHILLHLKFKECKIELNTNGLF